MTTLGGERISGLGRSCRPMRVFAGVFWVLSSFVACATPQAADCPRSSVAGRGAEGDAARLKETEESRERPPSPIALPVWREAARPHERGSDPNLRPRGRLSGLGWRSETSRSELGGRGSRECRMLLVWCSPDGWLLSDESVRVRMNGEFVEGCTLTGVGGSLLGAICVESATLSMPSSRMQRSGASPSMELVVGDLVVPIVLRPTAR